MSDPRGDCFAWAAKFAMKKPEAEVVHGTVEHPYDHNRFPHAWVEYRGSVWDEQHERMGRDLPSIEAFYKLWKPIVSARYTGRVANHLATKEGHWGPYGGVRRLPGGGHGRRL